MAQNIRLLIHPGGMESTSERRILEYIYRNVAKVGGLQSQGVRDEAVVAYRDPLTTQDLKSSGFPEG